MGLVYHVAQRMTKIITFIMLAGVFKLDVVILTLTYLNTQLL